MNNNRIIRSIAILFIISGIASQSIAQKAYKEITLKDIWWYGAFYPKTVDGIRSMDDGIHYTTIGTKGRTIEKYSYKTGKKIENLLDLDTLEVEGVPSISGEFYDFDCSYEFNHDESKILFLTKRQRIYRRSWYGEYYIYDVKNKTITPLSDNGLQQVASFSPKGNNVAFVRENNLFIKDLNTNEEIQITDDGKRNEIINGIPDWVYEEEFEFNKAYEWAPDGKSIAYIKFNEKNVKQYGILYYKGKFPTRNENVLYPDYYTYKYPKAGEENSKTSVHFYHLDTKQTVKANIPKSEYIPRIRWTKNSGKIAVLLLNRHQNHLDIVLADRKSGDSKKIFTEKNKYYIDETNFDYLTFLSDKEHFIWISEMDGYNHIYLYDLKGNVVNQITKGEWVVTDFLGLNEDNNTLYYISTEESPLQRHLYSINLRGRKKKKLSTNKGVNHADFSSGFKYYINTFSNTETPTITSLHNDNGKEIRVIEANKKLREKVKDYGNLQKSFFKFTSTENIKLNGWMIKPPDFTKDRKYPVFMTQYSGPNAQEVLDEWHFGWSQMMAQKGYIVVCVDGRGTGGRGEEFKKATYLQLGKLETIDQIETVKYLRTLPYIDSTRIGIYGWSYGGFISALCLTKGSDYFKTGIAVAPVTNWRYYDNIYTERFMRTPQENPKGYDNNSPINFVDKLKGKFLLIHGMADDNVHLQNSLEFAEALVQANKQFEMQYYLNRNHAIYGGNTRYHLFTKMTEFLLENL